MDMMRGFRYLFLFIIACVLVYAFRQLVPEKPLVRAISIGTAYMGLLYFAAALSIGPLNLIRSRRNPVSSLLRRDLGIWAALLAIVHTLVGLQAHMGGRFIHYFIYPPGESHAIPFRTDAFGLTNYLGLICTFIMIALLCLSNNRSLRMMGASSWKKWQRLTYFLALAIPIHGLVYQLLEKRIGLYTVLLLAITLTIFAVQMSGFIKYQRIKTSRQ
ncbi:hypothetical protein [uncultured Marinobacter sp.]|uniref:hypothetical protein n=1 Tax=uncultured Marinobacter sp. TaxID=187379 RepID=UPI0030DB68CC|tara:strand:+ start:168 stop:815 length:648 start_codon:yes stop_codon:yes gene_type:complete